MKRLHLVAQNMGGQHIDAAVFEHLAADHLFPDGAECAQGLPHTAQICLVLPVPKAHPLSSQNLATVAKCRARGSQDSARSHEIALNGARISNPRRIELTSSPTEAFIGP